jgi:hypothetical protein
MYEAIEERRITDPVTIKHVAEALGNYSPDRETEQHLRFDPHEAANELRQLAARQAELSEQETGDELDVDESSGDDSATVEPAEPLDDDNVLRGG